MSILPDELIVRSATHSENFYKNRLSITQPNILQTGFNGETTFRSSRAFKLSDKFCYSNKTNSNFTYTVKKCG